MPWVAFFFLHGRHPQSMHASVEPFLPVRRSGLSRDSKLPPQSFFRRAALQALRSLSPCSAISPFLPPSSRGDKLSSRRVCQLLILTLNGSDISLGERNGSRYYAADQSLVLKSTHWDYRPAISVAVLRKNAFSTIAISLKAFGSAMPYAPFRPLLTRALKGRPFRVLRVRFGRGFERPRRGR